jgi:RimJ/RimL family protein N-acetyltransferase
MLLESRGFRFIEMVYVPEFDFARPRHRLNHSDLDVCPAGPDELEAASDIAAVAFAHERFHVDPRVPREIGPLRYRNWVLSTASHPRQQLFLVRDGEIVVAFFVVEYLPDGTCYWHLNAVSPRHQGKGYGARSWSAMMIHAAEQGATRVRSCIVARNTRVINLYAGLGFRFSAPSMTFHWCRDQHSG